MDSSEKRHSVVVGLHTGTERSGLVWGIFVVLIGVALLLDHTGFITINHLYQYWPMIIVVAGIGQFFSNSNRTWGLFLIALGAIFQLQTLGIIRFRIAELWPIAIIAVGLLMVWGSFRGPVIVSNNKVVSGPEGADVLNAAAVFGGCERRVNSPNFKGGRATAIFGGVELDFRNAKIDGDKAVIEVYCIFGGVEIRVPDTWHVQSSTLPVMGGYSDKSRLAASTDPANQNAKTLVITGNIIFGGVDISN
ncbi:MAG TPA: DUF5668 domain-containing protein [Candidatus Acidoferrum sp.]|jgi:predicted membrane protein